MGKYRASVNVTIKVFFDCEAEDECEARDKYEKLDFSLEET